MRLFNAGAGVLCRCTMYVCLLALSGCLGGDSADALDDWEASDTWSIDPIPAVVLGTEQSGAPLHRIAGAARLSDGRFAIADGGTAARLLVFSSSGVFEQVIGPTGDAPGEFRWISHLTASPEDSLFVFDRTLQRLTAYSPTQQVARVTTFVPPRDGASGGGAIRVSRLADGKWVGQGMESMVQASPGTFGQDTVSVGLMDSSLSEYSLIALVPGLLTTSTMQMGRMQPMVPAFTPQALFATWGRCVFLSSTEDRRISVYGSDGRLVNSFDGPGEPREVTELHLAERVEAHLERFPDADREWYEQLFKSTKHTSHLPFYSSLVVDEWGHIWLQEYTPPYGLGTRWHILSQEGELLSSMAMPYELRVFSISEEGVLGRTADENEVETVHLLPFSTPPLAPAPVLPACSRP